MPARQSWQGPDKPERNHLAGIIELKAHDHGKLDVLARRRPGSLTGTFPYGMVAVDYAMTLDMLVVGPAVITPT